MLVYQRVIWPILYETSGWLLKLFNPQSHLRGQWGQCVNGLMFPYPPVSSWRSLGNLWTFYAAFDSKIIEETSDFWGYSMVDDTFFSSFLGGRGIFISQLNHVTPTGVLRPAMQQSCDHKERPNLDISRIGSVVDNPYNVGPPAVVSWLISPSI